MSAKALAEADGKGTTGSVRGASMRRGIGFWCLVGCAASLAAEEPSAGFSFHPGHMLQTGGFGLVLGSQTLVEASNTRDLLLISGAVLFAVGSVVLLAAPPPETPRPALVIPVVSTPLTPLRSPVPVWTPPSAIQALKGIVGLSVREGIEIKRITVAIAAPLLQFDQGLEISPAARAERVLTTLAESYREMGRSILTLKVHANVTADPEADRRLSADRAEALRAFFTDREGLEKDRVVGLGLGSSQPLVPATHPEAMRINARVEALFQGAETMDLPSPTLQGLAQTAGVQVRKDLEAMESMIIVGEEAVLFDVGSTKPHKSSDRALEKIAAAVREASTSPGKVQVRVEGHTDAVGTPEYHQRLSLERAQAVVRHLVVVHKLSDGMFEAVGFGATQPLADSATLENRAKNRRLQIIIKKSLSQ